jgi:hypothetical protein
MKMIGRATNPELLTASTQASFRNTGACDCGCMIDLLPELSYICS